MAYTEQQVLGGTVAFEVPFADYATSQWAGGSFTTNAAYTLTQLGVRLAKIGAPSGTITATIYSDNAGVPGSQLAQATATINAADLSTSPAMVLFEFAGLALSTGTRYWVVLKLSAYGDESNCVSWGVDTDGESEIFIGGSPTPTWADPVPDCQMTLTTYITEESPATLQPAPSDSVTVTETVSAAVTPLRPIAQESVTLTDAVVGQLSSADTITKFVVDNVTVLDSVALLLPQLRPAVGETVTITDTATVFRVSTLLPSVEESITVTETTDQFVFPGWIGQGEAITVTETVALKVVSSIRLTESIIVAESVTVDLTPTSALLAIVSDAITVSDDTAQFYPTWAGAVEDTVTLTEQVSVQVLSPGTLLATAAEAIEITEAVSGFFSVLVLEVADAVTIEETAALEVVAMLTVQVAEAITVSESPAGFETPLLASAVSLVGLSEHVDVLLSGIRNIHVVDAVTVTDTIGIVGTGLSSIVLRRRRVH